MRIKEKKIQGPLVETIVIPRPEEDIVFKCKAILDFSEFDKLIPVPEAPLKTEKGKKPFKDMEDTEYLDALKKRGMKRFTWIILQSLSATDGLIFETVNMQDPETWMKLEDELKDSGFSPTEVAMIFNGVTAANGMDEDKYKEARERFFIAEKQAKEV